MTAMTSMTVLWAAAVGLLVLTLLVLVPPLLRAGGAAGEGAGEDQEPGEERRRLQRLYAAQWAELQRELADPAQRAQAEEDLQRRLLEDLRAASPGPARAPLRPWLQVLPAALLSLLVPPTAWLLYQSVGDPQAAARLAAASSVLPAHAMAAGRPIAGEGAGGGRGADIEAVVRTLAARLDAQPDDLAGWVVLARSYETLERFGEAVAAYRRALGAMESQARAGPGAQADGQAAALRARLHADLADALASARGGALDGPVQAELDAALALDPDQGKALALAGTAAARRGDAAAARAHWQRLLGLLEPGSDVAARVQADLARLGGEGGVVAAAAYAVGGQVRLAESLRARVQPGDTVFIVARAPDAGRVPVAVLRLRAADLPVAFLLDDRLAMSPLHRLSAHESVVIEARVSRTGSAQRQPGDLLSAPQPARHGQRGVALTIEKAVD